MKPGTGAATRAAVKASSVNAFPAPSKTPVPQRTTTLASSSNMAHRGQDSSDDDTDGDEDASFQLPTPDSSNRQVSSPASVQSAEQSSECGEEPENSNSDQELDQDDDSEQEIDQAYDSDTAVEADESDNDAESEASDEVDDHHLYESDSNDIDQYEDEEADDADLESDKQGDVSEDVEYEEYEEYVPGDDTLALEEQGHWDWNNPDYDYEKDTLVYGNVRPFPREKVILDKIVSYLMPDNPVMLLEAGLRDSEVSAYLSHTYSLDDYEKVVDIMAITSASRASYKTLGGQAYRMFRFEFNKSVALKGLLTGSRKWEFSDGLPPVLGGIKTITIHKSFKEKFGDWCANMELLEAVDEEGKCKELNGLKEIIFTGMPAGRSVAEIGTVYMPSALEKIRALSSKLKKRGMQTWVVEDGGAEKDELKARLIYGHNMQDKEFGIHEGEVLLDPSYEMKSYRKVLALKKQNKVSRRLSTGLAAQPANKGKRRVASDAISRHTKKSPKKSGGAVRHRRVSGESEADDGSAGDDENDKLNRRLSDMTVDSDSDCEDPAALKAAAGKAAPVFNDSAMGVFRERLNEAASKADKKALRKAMHDLLDIQIKAK